MITPAFIDKLVQVLDYIALEGDGIIAIGAFALSIAISCLGAHMGMRLFCKLTNRGIGG